MKKSIFINFLLVACLVMLLASCNKVPKYAKMIPDDASVVVRLDVKKASENSKIGENKTVKDKIIKAIKDADLGRSARNKMEEIIDDPTKSGVDFSDPVMLYVAKDGDKDDVGLLGSVKDKDAFADFLNTLSKECDGDGVEDAKKDFSYMILDTNTGIFFNKDFFLLTDITSDKDKQEDDIDDIKKEFEEDGSSHSMADNPDMKAMCKKEGVLQILVEGRGLAEEKNVSDNFEDGLPSGVKLDDFSYLVDFNTEAGDATLSGEILSDSEAWKNYIAQYDEVLGNLGTSLNKYMSSDGLCAIVNVNGDKLYDLLKDFGYTKKMGDSADGKTYLKMLRSINGDAVMNLSDYDVFGDNKKIDGGIYISTDNNTIVNDFKKESKDQNGFETTGTDRYSIALGGGGYIDDYGNYVEPSEPSLYMNFGYKSGVSYFAMNDKKDKVGEPKNVLPEEFFKGKKAYFYMSSQLLKPAKDGMEKDVDDKEKAGYQTADEKTSLGIIKTFIENIDYIEGYYEGGGKSTLHLVMKDNNVDPLSALLDAFIDISEEAAKMAEEEPSADDAVVDTCAVDSAAYDYDYSSDNSYDEYGGDDYDYAPADSVAAY
ncbi:MAG: DUF4836 family protein [Prevotella sp.]|nr:DUF4836 family protein [Prevotella sp.]